MIHGRAGNVAHDGRVRIIGAGWGRTGTTSVAAALDLLGAGPVMTFGQLRRNPELAELWHREGIGEPVDWATELAGWGATLGWPGCWRWQEFANLWPTAPVLLTLREPQHWYASMRRALGPWLIPGSDIGPPNIAALAERVWTEDFDGWDQVLDEEETLARYEEYNDEVRAQCPPDRLIVWSVGDGWAPLCRALGVPVPDEPFPDLDRR